MNIFDKFKNTSFKLVIVVTGVMSLALAQQPASGAVIVVPNGLANTEGNSNNCIPLSGCGNRDRYQQVFDSSQFGALSGPELITEMRFRPDGGFGFAFTFTFANVQINLSTTTAAPDGMSSTFANNIGPDNTTVYSGALALSSADSGPGPRDFDVLISFQTPFLYDPSAGNLLFEFINFSGESSGRSIPLDSQSAGGDSVSRLFAPAVGDPNAVTGSLDSLGLVSQFTTIPGDITVEKKLLEGPVEIGIYLPDATRYVYEIAYTGPAALVVDTVPAEFEILALDASDGDPIFFDTSQGKGNSANRIEWLVPAGSNTLTVVIQTVASPGKGHKASVFKPTSCGPLVINDGAKALEVDENGDLVLVDVVDPETGEITLEFVVIVGPSNSLIVEAVAWAKPCVEEEAEEEEEEEDEGDEGEGTGP